MVNLINEKLNDKITENNDFLTISSLEELKQDKFMKKLIKKL